MIKFVGAAVWICIATLVAVYFSFQMSGPKPETDGHEAAAKVSVDTIKTDVMSIPLIREGFVAGYFLARLVFTVDAAEMKKLPIPAESIITDEMYSYIYSSPQLDFTKVASLDIDAFRNGLRDGINKKLQQELVKDVLIEQIDYLTKDDIRDAALKRHAPLKQEPAKPTGGEHDAPAH